MLRSSLITLVLSVATAATLAQTPTPTSTPTPATKDDVVRISTNLIQIDVSVVDKNGKTVTDLKSDEVEILENGKRQDLKGFSFVSKAPAANKTASTGEAAPAPVIGQPLSTVPARRVFALVVDDISLSYESSYYVRRGVLKFIDEQMVEGDMVAILKTGVSTGFLQQFTSDKELLRAAAATIRWNPAGYGGITPLTDTEDVTAPEREREDILATSSLNSLNQMIKGMAVLPGRKSVIFFSEGFSLLMRNEDGFVDSSRVLDSIRRITDSANRSSVVVYTIDSRGLQVGLPTAEMPGPSGIRTGGPAFSPQRERLVDTQDGLRVLAREAGGFAVLNTNSISKGIEKVLDDQGYYLVAYEPDVATFDPKTSKFNRIEVKIKRAGLSARYRSGFFNQATVEKAPTATTSTGETTTMASALVSPFVKTEINLRLQSLYAKDPMAKSMVRSFVHIPGSDLTFTKLPDGKLSVDFDILAVSFASDGLVADQLGRNYKIEATEEGRAKLLRDGIVYYFTFPISRPGAYQYRVAVRDRTTGRMGTAGQLINVPDEKKRPLTLSGIGLENMTKDEFVGGPDKTKSDALRDTSLRRFKRGSVLVYGAEAYRQKGKQMPGATWQIRLYREGKIVLNGTVSPLKDQTTDRSPISGALELGSSLEPGEYILQLTVLGKPGDKKLVATQAVSFELVD